MPRRSEIRCLAAALLLLAGCSHLPPPEPPLDSTLERDVDATGDGEPDRISLHLWAASSNAPVRWQLEIESRGKTVFQYGSDDSGVDAVFSEPSRFGNCRTYLECKRRYYRETILGNLVQPAPSDWDEVSTDASEPGSIRSVAYQYLTVECGLNDTAAGRAVADIIETLRAGRGILIHVPRNPFENLPPMIYSPAAGRFVPIALE